MAWLFVLLLTLGVLGPAVVGAFSCGDCCEGTCGTPTTGFSLCCFHSASTLPDQPASGFGSVEVSCLTSADDTDGLPPHPRDILHVPRPFLT